MAARAVGGNGNERRCRRWVGSPDCSSIRSRGVRASSSGAPADGARLRARPALDDRRPPAAGSAASASCRSWRRIRPRGGGWRAAPRARDEAEQVACRWATRASRSWSRSGVTRSWPPVDPGSIAPCGLSANPCGWCVSRTKRGGLRSRLYAGRQPHRLRRRVPAPGHERGLAGRAEQGAASHGAAPVPMDRFRPNIVLAGMPAGAEDRHGSSELGGELSWLLVKPCDRCVVTTVDQSRWPQDRQGAAGDAEADPPQPADRRRLVRPKRGARVGPAWTDGAGRRCVQPARRLGRMRPFATRPSGALDPGESFR